MYKIREVYNIPEKKNRPSLAIILLLHVLASMRSHLTKVCMTACIFSEALTPLYPTVWHELVTYTGKGLESGTSVQLMRIASPAMRLSLNDIWSDGGTPTGEAIAAALVPLTRRHSRRGLIIHFTSGHPKNKYVVRQGSEQCHNARIDVTTVSVAAGQNDLYASGNGRVISRVSELLGAVMQVFRKTHT